MTRRTKSPDLAKLLKARKEIPLSRILSYIWHCSVPGMPSVWLGAGDTLIPGIMNLASLRGVRTVLTIFLVPRFGLYEAWIAMDIELCFRGMIFLIRLTRTKWEKIAYAG
ncbi:hypothetical protein [Treponema socranskii]|uniref:hypothetical protein n=1 Tax=Treponema socranskii TaxID=53419 RepID=UPI0028E9B201|nr:hypothetical protein [Treponema socranskii]